MLKVCLMSPLPPPYGGIAHWSSMVMKHASSCTDVEFVHIDIAPRWRPFFVKSRVLRSVGGGLQLLRDVVKFSIRYLSSHFSVVHLVSSGGLACVRDLLIMLLSKAFAVPIVYHIRYGRIPNLRRTGSLEWVFQLAVLRLAAKVIAIDGSTYSALCESIGCDKVVLLPNPFDPAELPLANVPESGSRRVIFVGWVTPAKGVFELIEAWQAFNHPGWVLDIVGPIDENIRSQVQTNATDSSIVVSGLLPHQAVIERVSQADIFVLPSHSEGFPNAVLEAMALGRAIIASDVGAIPEMLEGDCGVTFPVRDVRALASALRSLIGDPCRRVELGRNAHDKARRLYSLPVVFARYEAIWRSLATAPKGRGTDES